MGVDFCCCSFIVCFLSPKVSQSLFFPLRNLGCQCRSSWSSIPSQNVGYAETNRKVGVIHIIFYEWAIVLEMYLKVFEHHSKGKNQCSWSAYVVPVDILNENLPSRKLPSIKILSCHVIGLGYNVPLFSV